LRRTGGRPHARAGNVAPTWRVSRSLLSIIAVNDVEMSPASRFDRTNTERELGWARDWCFNRVRAFLAFVVGEADADRLKQRFTEFLATANRPGIWVAPNLFDDCHFAGCVAVVGREPEQLRHPEREWEKRRFTVDVVVARALVPFRGKGLLCHSRTGRGVHAASAEDNRR
jgi:hypothetical protein